MLEFKIRVENFGVKSRTNFELQWDSVIYRSLQKREFKDQVNISLNHLSESHTFEKSPYF